MRYTALLAIVFAFVSQGCAMERTMTKPDDSSPCADNSPCFVEMVDKDGKPIPNTRAKCDCRKCKSYGGGQYSGPGCCFPWPGACGSS